MPSLLRRYIPTRAPVYAAQLDRSNPLTAGLFFAYTPANFNSTPTNSTADRFTRLTPQGPALAWTYLGSGTPIFTIPTITSAEWSFAAYAWNPNAASYKTICNWYDSAAGTSLQALHFRVYYTGSIGADLRPQQPDFNGSLTWPQYETHLLGASISAAGGYTALWWDGRLDTSAAISSSSARTIDRFQLFAKEGTNAADSSDAGGAVMIALAWNRALSDVEWARLAANPWQVFQPGAELLIGSTAPPVDTALLTRTGFYLQTATGKYLKV